MALRFRAERLPQYIQDTGISMSEFAAQLGVTRETVRAWCAMEYKPTLQHVEAMDALTSGRITARSFYSEEILKELEEI